MHLLCSHNGWRTSFKCHLPISCVLGVHLNILYDENNPIILLYFRSRIVWKKPPYCVYRYSTHFSSPVVCSSHRWNDSSQLLLLFGNPALFVFLTREHSSISKRALLFHLFPVCYPKCFMPQSINHTISDITCVTCFVKWWTF